MKIVKLSSLSEKERKKVLEEQEKRYQNNMASRDAEIQRVNQLFTEKMLENNTKQDNATNNSNVGSMLLNPSKTININTNNEEKTIVNKSQLAVDNALKKSNEEQYNNYKQEKLQKQVEQQVQQSANKINQDMSNGNYASAIKHILTGVPQKALDATTTTFASINSIVAPKKISSSIADENELLKTNKKLTSKYENTTANIDNDIVKTASGISGTLGAMVPSILSNFALPGSGAIVQGINVGADAYQDTLNKDASNKLQASITGATKGVTSALIEKISGGNILGKGSLDDTATNFIANRFKGKAGQKLASKAYEMIGEIGEENLENQVGYVIDKIVNNKELPNAQEWWSELGETSKSTFLTTVVLNILGLGGDTYNDVQKYGNDKQTQQYIKEAQNIIRAELNSNNNININNKTKALNELNNIKTIEDYNQYLRNNQINFPSQQIIQGQNKMSQNQTSQELNSILNNKVLPMQSYQYEASNNQKINNLRQDASKYFTNSQQAHNYVEMLEKIITDKNIDIRLDGNLKTADGKVVNGSYSNGVITINPNSNRVGEFIAIHELTHAIGTKEMLNMVNTYRQSNAEFDTAVKQLLNNYQGIEITEEALSDVSAQLFGNQEFINNLAQNNPNIFQKIYSEIKYLWHQFRGYKNQNQFVEDLYYKWTQAYNSNNKLNETSNYSIAGIKGMNNVIKQDTSNLIIEQSYNRALQMAKNNIDNEVIRKNTGWFQDRNGDWKFEFSDKNMSLKTNIKLEKNKTYKLSQILEHDILFQAYPELANYNVKILANTNVNGSFNKSNKTINISDRLINNNKLTEGTLIHEIQHAIQNIEGFERGKSSKKSKLAYYNSLGEIEATDTKTRFIKEKYKNNNISNIAPESSKLNPQHKDLNNYLKNRNLLDKVKDSVYNYFNNKNGGNNNEINQEIVLGNTEQDSSLVDGRKRINEQENSNKSSFSMQDNQGRTRISDKSIGNGSSNSNNVKYSIQESENNSELSEEAKKQLHRYVNMDKKELNKAFSDVVDNKENMLMEYNTLQKEYKEFQSTEEFKNALNDFVYSETPRQETTEKMNKANKYAEKLRYYNEQYEKYKAQQDAINSILMGNETDTRSSEQIVKEAEKHFGTTTNFKETAYIDINGKQIDFSGKHEGGPSGARTLDHRQINEIDVDMDSFIEMGNIRILPEGGGINLKIEPNENQYSKLKQYIDSVDGEIYIDIDKANSTYDSAEYKRGTSTNKIISDLQYYFKNGEFPKQSQLAQFRYSQNTPTWQKYLEKNFKSNGTRTSMQDILPTTKDIERIKNKSQSENNKIPGREDLNLPKTKQELLENNSKALNKYIQEKNSTIRKVEAQISRKQQELDLKENKDSIIANKLKTQIIELSKKKKDIELMYNKKIDDTFNKGEKIIQSQDMSGRKVVIEKNRKLAREKISNIATWKDKNNGFKYQRETMERNMFDIIPNKEEAQDIVDTYFEPIHKSEAEKQKFINKYNDKIKELNLNKYESEAVQLLGEQKYNPDFKADDVKQVLDKVNENIENGKVDKEKVNKAIEVFRNIYDKLFELENKALKENGYPEKPYRKGYFPHFIDSEPITKTEKILDKLGFKIDKRPLPTDIAGITEQFVPGKTWNRSSLNRKTDKTTYNALKGFDTYISQATDNIFHTENIQKLRALENEIRYQYSDKGIQERIDEIYNNDILNQEEQQAAIEKIFEQIDNPMPNLVVELRRYTNALANKKSEADRSAEQKYGRQLYSTVNAIENRFGANAVGLNIGSAITNFIPITQAYSQVSTKNMGRATLDTIKSYIQDDGFVDKSTFLTNRINKSEKLYKTSLEKISDKTSFLFNAIDDLTSNIIVRGKYLENINNGMNETEAIKNADRFAANVMADRSKGALPTLFEEKSPITKVFTQFQLEVNNQYSYMFKDIPRDLKEKGLANIALAFFKMFVATWLYNKVSEEITGRKPAFSPIDIAVSTYDIMSDSNTKTADKLINTSKNIVEEVPFVGSFFGGGRIPISGALPDAENTFKAATGLITGEMDSNKAINTLGKEVSKPLYYLLPPFGGAQAKKTIEGISTVTQGGSYVINSKGEKELRFPVENANVGDYIKAGVFGKYALPLAKEYEDRDYKRLSSKQTKTYEESKVPYKEYLDYLSYAKQENIKKEDKIKYLNEQDWNENQKWGIYKNEILSNTEREKDGGSQLTDAEYMLSKGITKTEYMKIYSKAQMNNIDMPTQEEYNKMNKSSVSLNNYIDYKIEVKKQTEEKRKNYELTSTQDLKDKDKIQILLNSNYSTKEITGIYENYIKSSKDSQYDVLNQSGIDIKEYLKYKQQEFESDKKEDGTVDGKTVSGSKKRKVYSYVNNMNISYNQKLLLLGMQYSLTNTEKTKLAKYVNNMKISKNEKLDIYEKLSGFTVYKNGRVTW